MTTAHFVRHRFVTLHKALFSCEKSFLVSLTCRTNYCAMEFGRVTSKLEVMFQISISIAVRRAPSTPTPPLESHSPPKTLRHQTTLPQFFKISLTDDRS